MVSVKALGAGLKENDDAQMACLVVDSSVVVRVRSEGGTEGCLEITSRRSRIERRTMMERANKWAACISVAMLVVSLALWAAGKRERWTPSRIGALQADAWSLCQQSRGDIKRIASVGPNDTDFDRKLIRLVFLSLDLELETSRAESKGGPPVDKTSTTEKGGN